MKILRRLVTYCFIFLIHNSYSQTISLYNQFNGRYDYTAIGNTLNIIENGAFFDCDILTESEADVSLENNQEIVAAYLYWGGSGSGDFEVKLNQISISASRTFQYNLDENREFFAAFSDVTQIVENYGNGSYIVSDLEQIDITQNYCNTGTNFAGWALIIIYEDQGLPLNQINIYDGLEAVPDEITIILDNLNVIDVDGAKIGFIAWEGDVSLSVNETLKINGHVLSNPPLNPENNAFNGTNSFDQVSGIHNMDIDFYDIQNTINIGDISATIELSSGQDLVMVNNIITVLNSQLPDATIKIESQIETSCFNREITLNYTVYNYNSTDILPSNTPLTFYIENNIIAQTVTDEIIGINEFLTSEITIDIPDEFTDFFEITARIDDLGDGSGIVSEISEDNNIFLVEVEIPSNECPIFIPQGFSPNGDGFNDHFNIQGLYDVFLDHKLQIFNRFGKLVFEGNNDKKWDGRSNRGINSQTNILPVGTYFYILYPNELSYDKITGWVYLNY